MKIEQYNRLMTGLLNDLLERRISDEEAAARSESYTANFEATSMRTDRSEPDRAGFAINFDAPRLVDAIDVLSRNSQFLRKEIHELTRAVQRLHGPPSLRGALVRRAFEERIDDMVKKLRTIYTGWEVPADPQLAAQIDHLVLVETVGGVDQPRLSFEKTLATFPGSWQLPGVALGAKVYTCDDAGNLDPNPLLIGETTVVDMVPPPSLGGTLAVARQEEQDFEE